MRDFRDFYRTPEWCVQALYQKVLLPNPTLDPCAGDGALLRAAPGSKCRGIEKDPRLVEAGKELGTNLVCADGLEESWKYQFVLMNPPFKDATTWVQKAINEAESAAILLRLGFLASQRRRELLQERPPGFLVILSKRPSFTPDGKTDSYDYGWFIWHRGNSGLTKLDWITD
jgi:hypothetical protein